MHFVSQNMDGALVGKSAHIEVHSRGVELVEEDVEEEGEEEGGPAGGQHAAHLPRGEEVGVAIGIHQHHVRLHAQNTGHRQPRHQEQGTSYDIYRSSYPRFIIVNMRK